MIDGYLVSAIVTPILVVGLLVLLWLGWRAKHRQQAGLGVVPAAEAVTGTCRLELGDVHYVSTTFAERPLERVVAEPLGFRGRCLVRVHDDGLVVTIQGSRPFAVPARSIRAIDVATTTIDRVVEPGGLTVVAWTLGDAELRTQFRVVDQRDRDRLQRALHELLPEYHPLTEESR